MQLSIQYHKSGLVQWGFCLIQVHKCSLKVYWNSRNAGSQLPLTDALATEWWYVALQKVEKDSHSYKGIFIYSYIYKVNIPECTPTQLEAQSSPKGVSWGEGERHSPLADPEQAEMFSSSRGVCFPPPQVFSSSTGVFRLQPSVPWRLPFISVGLSQGDGTIACYGQGLVTLVIHALYVPCSPSFESWGMCKSIC